MGSVLGPMLQKDLKKKWGIKAKRWGKASSGLARPDFHDWPAEVPNLMRRHRPDYVVVSLGTNDHQALKTKKGWIKTSNERWAKSYKQRVLIMLRRISGRDRRRAVVWLGPTNFDSNNARKLGPKINALIREAIDEFDGPAVFVDARRATSDSKGEPGTTFKHPTKGSRPMRAADGIHLTTEAVRNLLAAPVHKAFGECWDADVAARDAIRAQRKAERIAKRKAKKAARDAARAEKAAKKDAEKAAKGQEAPKDDKRVKEALSASSEGDKTSTLPTASEGKKSSSPKKETSKSAPNSSDVPKPVKGDDSAKGALSSSPKKSAANDEKSPKKSAANDEKKTLSDKSVSDKAETGEAGERETSKEDGSDASSTKKAVEKPPVTPDSAGEKASDAKPTKADSKESQGSSSKSKKSSCGAKRSKGKADKVDKAEEEKDQPPPKKSD